MSHDEKDDLEELIAECAQEEPDFPAMVEAALQRRQAMRAQGRDPNGEAQADADSNDEEPEVAAPRRE